MNKIISNVNKMVKSYKLNYFDIRGRGEPIRLIFEYAQQKFENKRINLNEWPKLKPTVPYEKVPFLEVDGKKLSQSYAIGRYLAREFGLAGKDAFEEAKVDEIADFHRDFAEQTNKFVLVCVGLRQGDKEELRKELIPIVDEAFPVYLNLLKESSSGFFVPSGLTWVDLFIAEFLYTLQIHDEASLKRYPDLIVYYQRVFSHPKIKDYVEKRKKIVF